MIRYIFASSCALAALVLVAATGPVARGQIAYGVNSNGILFKFDVTTPAVVTTVGLVGFVPEGIDFRPGSDTLYAVDIGPTLSQLYTLSITNGVPTPVGGTFPTAGTVNAVNYDLAGNNTFGFDFNPKTLMLDGSMRIRLIATDGSNLRLNSSTGQVASADTELSIQPGGASPFTDAAAYINNIPADSGATTLYAMDSRNQALFLLNSPNNGQMTNVGAFGPTNVQRNIGFDVFTTPGSADDTIGGDFGYAVLKRPDAPINGPLGAYMLYTVNLASGTITNGALVGGGIDFDGGFAVRPIPEPATLGLALVAGCVALARRRRRA